MGKHLLACARNGSPLGVDDVQAEGPDNGELASRLSKLFEVMRKAGTAPLSNAAAAAAITKKTGVSISPAYLWQLRSGVKRNPTVAHLRAIADFFGVPASYLIDRDPDQKIDAQLSLMQALRDVGVRDLAVRTSGLTPQAITSLAAMVDEVRKLQDLPVIPREGGEA
ncbi:helix-turn-helix domain-containing protein [Mycobacterium colombiense]|uniref:helix-turn-helix domain-containing protein n=3 Tax=Mycobacterium colombiense TaxID=339268 RepID=UPI0035321A78